MLRGIDSIIESRVKLPVQIKGEGIFTGKVEIVGHLYKYIMIVGMQNFQDTGKIMKHFVESTEIVSKKIDADVWCLLEKGYFGGPNKKGAYPYHLCAPRKLAFGWAKAKDFELGDKELNIAIRSVEVFCDIAKVKIDKDEFLVFENRNKLALHADIHKEGVIVWHINPSGETKVVRSGILSSRKIRRVRTSTGKYVTIFNVAYDTSKVGFVSIRKGR